MDARQLEKRLRRLEKASAAQAARLENLASMLGAVVMALERMEHQILHDHHELEEIKRRLRPHHYPATTAVIVRAA